MAAQLLSQKEIQMPHLPGNVPEGHKLLDHPCQCHAEPSAKDLAGLAAKLLKVMKACAVVRDHSRQ